MAFSVFTRIQTTPESRFTQSATSITLTNVLYSAEKIEEDGSMSSDSRLMDLVLPIAEDGRSALLAVTRTVDLPGGTQGTGSVSVRLDIKTGCGVSCTYDQ